MATALIVGLGLAIVTSIFVVSAKRKAPAKFRISDPRLPVRLANLDEAAEV